METRSRMSRSLHTNRDFEKLEPYEGKPSRTVLRGEEGSNALDLPDHHISDLKGWGCVAGEAYGINSIPATILFDPQGKVVATGLRGEELDKTLSELLK